MCRQGELHDSRACFDFSQGSQAGRSRISEYWQNVGSGSFSREGLQNVENWWSGEYLLVAPASEGFRGLHPFSCHQLAVDNRWLCRFANPPLEEKETVIESDGRYRWSPPTTSRNEPLRRESKLVFSKESREDHSVLEKSLASDFSPFRRAGAARGEQEARFLEKLSESAGEHPWCQVHIVDRDSRIWRGTSRGLRIPIGWKGLDRDLAVGAMEGSSRKRIPTAHETEFWRTPYPIDLQAWSRPPENHGRRRANMGAGPK